MFYLVLLKELKQHSGTNAKSTAPSENTARYLSTCTGEMASKLLALGGRPFGMTPGGGCLALFMTLLQFATMVRIVSDSS